MALDNQKIQERLSAVFEGKVGNFSDSFGLLSVQVKKDALIDVVSFLRDDPEMRFIFLTDLCGVHFPDNDPEMQFSGLNGYFYIIFNKTSLNQAWLHWCEKFYNL
jgi:NADH-quinone oxidoreductase subunit C